MYVYVSTAVSRFNVVNIRTCVTAGYRKCDQGKQAGSFQNLPTGLDVMKVNVIAV